MKKILNVTIATSSLLAVLALSPSAYAQQLSGNVLVNGDFEMNVQSTYGNHLKYDQNEHPTGWTFGQGQAPNIVKVDGPGGQATWYTTGPDSDGSNAGAGVNRQYLDIANGSNKFYQTFVPKCTGKVKFGGAFSNRGGAGRGTLAIRNGNGFNGSVVGQTNVVNVTSGSPVGRPWVHTNFSTNVSANQTYSFVVDMNDNTNFDEGYVKFETKCDAYPPEVGTGTGGAGGNVIDGGIIGNPGNFNDEIFHELDPDFDLVFTPPPPSPVLPKCCSPWNATVLKESLKYKGSGNITDPYTLRYAPDASVNTQMEAYINYLHALDPGVTSITVNFRLYDKGQNPTSAGLGSMVGSEHFVTWTAGGSSAPSNGGGNFFNLPSQGMSINNWYRIHSGVYLNNGKEAFGKDCANNEFMMNIQVQSSNQKSSGGGNGSAQLKILEGGRIKTQILKTTRGQKLKKRPVRQELKRRERQKLKRQRQERRKRN